MGKNHSKTRKTSKDIPMNDMSPLENYSFSFTDFNTKDKSNDHFHILNKSSLYSNNLDSSQLSKIIKKSKNNERKSTFPSITRLLTDLGFSQPKDNSPIIIKEIRKSDFQIKKAFDAENFEYSKKNTSFLDSFANRNPEMKEKISIKDILSYKPGRKIIFKTLTKDDNNKPSNPFEDIRIDEQINNRKSFFKDDMAIKDENIDNKQTPEEKNLPSPYYNLMKKELSTEENKLYNLAEELVLKVKEANETDLSGFEKIYEDFENESRLQIFMKTYVTKEKTRINIFRNQFIVPCSPDFFLNFMNNIPEQSKIDTHLDDFHITKEILTNLNILYLSYKKVLISAPRELVYLKYIKQINENLWVDASQSIEYEEIPRKKEKIRAEIILSGHYVQKDEGGIKSIVRLYSECDFKTNVPVFMTKSFSISEMKRYTAEVCKRIKQIKEIN